MKKIRRVQIDPTELSADASTRQIVVSGDNDAVFSLQVSRSSDGKYYDFKSTTFSTPYTSVNRLTNIKLEGGSNTTNIVFPSTTNSDTYTIYVWAEPHFNTEFSIDGLKQKTKYFYTTNIKQRPSNKTITFTWEYGAKSTITALPFSGLGNLGTSTGGSRSSFTSSTAPSINFSTELETTGVTTDAGVKLKSVATGTNLKEYYDEVFFWQTGASDYTTTSASTHDAGSDSTDLVLNTVDNLYVGMYIHSIESAGAYASNAAWITSIDEAALSVTLSSAQTWASDKDIVFNAYGIDLIRSTSGVGLIVDDAFTASLTQLSTTLRTAIGSGQTTANVNGTGGISLGATVRSSFYNSAYAEDLSSITAISQHVSNGVITVGGSQFQVAHTGSIIYIDGSSNKVKLFGDIKISKYPTSNQTIYFDLTKILIAGTYA